MAITGHVHRGVVVFDGTSSLPDGTTMQIVPIPSPIKPPEGSWDAAMQAANELRDYDFDAWPRLKLFAEPP